MRLTFHRIGWARLEETFLDLTKLWCPTNKIIQERKTNRIQLVQLLLLSRPTITQTGYYYLSGYISRVWLYVVQYKSLFASFPLQLSLSRSLEQTFTCFTNMLHCKWLLTLFFFLSCIKSSSSTWFQTFERLNTLVSSFYSIFLFYHKLSLYNQKASAKDA